MTRHRRLTLTNPVVSFPARSVMMKTSVVGSMSFDLQASTNRRMAILDRLASDAPGASSTWRGGSICRALKMVRSGYPVRRSFHSDSTGPPSSGSAAISSSCSRYFSKPGTLARRCFRETHIWYREREASARWLMMLLVATTCPFAGAENVVAVVSEFNEVEEFAEGNVAAPDSWLARGALGTLMVFNRSAASKGAAAGPVFMRRRGAWAITHSPFAQRRWRAHGRGGLDGVGRDPRRRRGQVSIGAVHGKRASAGGACSGGAAASPRNERVRWVLVQGIDSGDQGRWAVRDNSPAWLSQTPSSPGPPASLVLPALCRGSEDPGSETNRANGGSNVRAVFQLSIAVDRSCAGSRSAINS